MGTDVPCVPFNPITISFAYSGGPIVISASAWAFADDSSLGTMMIQLIGFSSRLHRPPRHARTGRPRTHWDCIVGASSGEAQGGSLQSGGSHELNLCARGDILACGCLRMASGADCNFEEMHE